MCLKLFHPNLNSKRDAPSSTTPERPLCTLSCYNCLVLYLSDLSNLITVEIISYIDFYFFTKNLFRLHPTRFFIEPNFKCIIC